MEVVVLGDLKSLVIAIRVKLLLLLRVARHEGVVPLSQNLGDGRRRRLVDHGRHLNGLTNRIAVAIPIATAMALGQGIHLVRLVGGPDVVVPESHLDAVGYLLEAEGPALGVAAEAARRGLALLAHELLQEGFPDAG